MADGIQVTDTGIEVATSGIVVAATTDPCCCAATGACCVGGTCSVLTAAACTTAGGTWKGAATSCSPNPCVPCSTCTGTQPSASVVASGPCATQGDFTGSYPFFVFATQPAQYCQWGWFRSSGGHTFQIELTYCLSTARLYVRVFGSGTAYYGVAGGSVCGLGVPFIFVEITSAISCVSGKLTGGFALSGLQDCLGTNITVTLG